MNTDPMQDLRALAERQNATAEQGRLAQRVRVMAQRWRYTPEDLAEALRLAADDPAGWQRLVEHDERMSNPGDLHA